MNSASVKELQSCSPPNQQEAEVCWDHPTSSEHRPLQSPTLLLCNSTPLNAHRQGQYLFATTPHPLALEVFLLAWRWLVPGAGSLSSVRCCSGSWDVAAAAAAVVTLIVFFRFAT